MLFASSELLKKYCGYPELVGNSVHYLKRFVLFIKNTIYPLTSFCKILNFPFLCNNFMKYSKYYPDLFSIELLLCNAMWISWEMVKQMDRWDGWGWEGWGKGQSIISEDGWSRSHRKSRADSLSYFWQRKVSKGTTLKQILLYLFVKILLQ